MSLLREKVRAFLAEIINVLSFLKSYENTPENYQKKVQGVGELYLIFLNQQYNYCFLVRKETSLYWLQSTPDNNMQFSTTGDCSSCSLEYRDRNLTARQQVTLVAQCNRTFHKISSVALGLPTHTEVKPQRHWSHFRCITEDNEYTTEVQS